MELLTTLLTWYRSPVPVVSAYLDLHPADVTAGRDDLQLRWRRLRGQLHDDGAPENAVRLLDGQVETLQPAPRSAALFSNGMEVLRLDIDRTADHACAGPLPYGLPALHWYQRHVPYVLALVDRTGGDLSAYGADGRLLLQETVTGPDDEVERNAPGGWAQPRYQRRAEDSWRHNAGAVARVLERVAQRSGARLVAVAGDVRAVQLLHEQANNGVREVLHDLDHGGGRTDDGSQAVRAAAVQRLVHQVAGDAVTAAVERFHAGLGQAADSVVGAGPTIQALCRGAVDVLFVVDDAADRREAWYGDEPTDVATERGDATPNRARLPDVLVRAATGSGARVVVLDEPLPEAVDGVAAVCRF